MLAQNRISIPELMNSFRNGKISPVDYLFELEQAFQKKESVIQAFLPEPNRFSRMIKTAENLTLQYPETDDRPALFCLPIGVKDIFHVDGFQTRAGSQLPKGLLTGSEADSVTILKKAGALIVGKNVTTEFAYFAPGPTRNPHNPNHTPGGSSSGSAAAVAAGLVPFAFGTQTIGSIIRPASFCGVVGFKPTYDRISKRGVIPLSPSVDTVGFFVLDIESARMMSSILCTNWRIDRLGITKPVLGIPRGPYLTNASENMLEHFERIGERLRKAGYQVKDIRVMKNFDEIFYFHNTIVSAEASKIHQKWYEKYKDLYHPKTSELIEKGIKIPQRKYEEAQNHRGRFRADLTKIMEIQGIDVWISPPAIDAAPVGLDSTGDPIMNLPWTHCGFPTINLPAGKNDNYLPMGLQLTSGWNMDEALLHWSSKIEEIITEDI
jgi:Asp-tRNA(Asn)/Glu-tRNA(Gln) amidotransferase A subunit family amidase